MRRVALALGFVLASTAGAQQFEGIVTYSMGASGQGFQYMSKGNKVRFQSDDPRMAGAGMIIDGGAQTMTIMMPQQKMAMTRPIPPFNKATMDTVHGKATKVGSETVAGVPCDDYEGTDSKGQKTGTICLARGMGTWMMAVQMNPMMQSMKQRISGFSDAIAGGAFPLKFTKSDGTVDMIATKVEKKPMDDGLFTVPADYKTMQMPGGMAPQ